MTHGLLREYFSGVGVKRLSAVDADRSASNQHEVGITREMCDLFLGQNHRERFSVVYVWLGEDQDGTLIEGQATHYDTRWNKQHRSPEWRLVYQSNTVTDRMKAGDALFLALGPSRVLYFVVTAPGSTSERQLSWLFGMHPQGNLFASREFGGSDSELGYAARFVLDELGIEPEEPDVDRLDVIIDRFNDEFPRTSVLSDLARSTVTNVQVIDDPDEALVAWLDHEEALFRRLEHRIVTTRLERGFVNDIGTDVEAFIQYSLSVHNRRKSRRGHSLENHLEAVFKAFGIKYVRSKVTENYQKPDFLFPSDHAYRAAPPEGAPSLVMLGAKSTCKDRWRQVLAEASKIPRKHLLTLEPGVSERQTDQMDSSGLQLVVPQSVHVSYTDSQQEWIWNLREFIRHVETQKGN